MERLENKSAMKLQCFEARFVIVQQVTSHHKIFEATGNRGNIIVSTVVVC